MVDWSKVKKEFIPASEVPSGHAPQGQWDEVFGSIPKGQALVLHEPEVNSSTVRQALQRMQKHGKYKNLRVSTKGVHATATVYITNTEKALTRVPRVSLEQSDKQTS
jgi:hypothetical protein